MHDELFIVEDDQILVYPRTATGDVAPIRVIRGPKTRLSDADAIVVDPIHDLIIVFDKRGDASSGGYMNRKTNPSLRARQKFGALLIFNRTDSGDVEPRSVIEGPKAGMIRVNQIQVYPEKGWIFVALRPLDDTYFAGVWSINDSGDVPPRWVLGDIPAGYRPGRTIAFDPIHKEVFGTAYARDSAAVLLRYSFPEVFK